MPGGLEFNFHATFDEQLHTAAREDVQQDIHAVAIGCGGMKRVAGQRQRMEVPVDFIAVTAGLVQNVAVDSEDVAVAQVFASRVVEETDVIDAMPAVDPAASVIVDHLSPKAIAETVLQHGSDIGPGFLVGEQLRRDHRGNIGLEAV